MAQSKCVKCGSTAFEITEAMTIQNARDTVHFVQCSQCGGVVGVQEPFSAWQLIAALAQKLGHPVNDLLR